MDSNPCTKKKCFNGKGIMRCTTEAQYATYWAVETSGIFGCSGGCFGCAVVHVR